MLEFVLLMTQFCGLSCTLHERNKNEELTWAKIGAFYGRTTSHSEKKRLANLGKETRRKIQNCHHIHAEGKKYITSPTHGNSSPLSPLLEAINFGKHCASTRENRPENGG